MTARHIYHYYAFEQGHEGTTVNIDGILLMDEPVCTMKQYRAIKEIIVLDKSGAKYRICDPTRLTISSLSYLGKEDHE